MTKIKVKKMRLICKRNNDVFDVSPTLSKHTHTDAIENKDKLNGSSKFPGMCLR